MCEWNTLKPIYINRGETIREIMVDSCIADYVQQMNDLGIETIGCCCGHFRSPSTVLVDKGSEELMLQYQYSFSRYGYPDGTFCLEHIIDVDLDQSGNHRRKSL